MRTVRAALVALVAVAAALSLAGCGSGPTPASPPLTVSAGPSTTVPADVVAPEGFEAAIIEVTAADGSTETFCVWLATTPEQQAEGLMAVTSLGGADGMLFRFGQEHNGQFWMKNTLLPLSIGFFDARGEYVSGTDMSPCPPGEDACPLYGADAPYADALEVVQGDLPRLGVADGSRLRVTGRSCAPSG